MIKDILEFQCSGKDKETSYWLLKKTANLCVYITCGDKAPLFAKATSLPETLPATILKVMSFRLNKLHFRDLQFKLDT